MDVVVLSVVVNNTKYPQTSLCTLLLDKLNLLFSKLTKIKYLDFGLVWRQNFWNCMLRQ